MNYWHFMAEKDGHPIMRDGVVPIVGQRYEIEGDPIMCVCGYHGSLHAIDALMYAPGPWVSQRPLEGVIDGDNKSVGCAFIQTKYADATDILWEFARWCAGRVVHLWDAPEVVIQYLSTGDASLRVAAQAAAQATARAATWDTAQDTAWDAAWAAAQDTAQDAAWDAAQDTAWDAAWAAAQDTAQDAAWDAAWDEQEEKLRLMLLQRLEAEK